MGEGRSQKWRLGASSQVQAPWDAPEDGLSRVAFRTTTERYPLHTGALEELDTLLLNYLAFTYH